MKWHIYTLRFKRFTENFTAETIFILLKILISFISDTGSCYFYYPKIYIEIDIKYFDFFLNLPFKMKNINNFCLHLVVMISKHFSKFLLLIKKHLGKFFKIIKSQFFD